MIQSARWRHTHTQTIYQSLSLWTDDDNDDDDNMCEYRATISARNSLSKMANIVAATA